MLAFILFVSHILLSRVCEASGWIVNELTDAACAAGCFAVKTAFEAAELAMTAAQKTLEGVQLVTKGAMSVLSAIAAGLNAFQIYSIDAGFQLQGAQGASAIAGSVHVALDAKIFGSRLNVGATIDFNNLAQTAWQLFKSAVQPLIDVFSLRQQRLLDRGMSVEVGNLTYDDDIDVNAILSSPEVRAFLASAQLFHVRGLQDGSEPVVDLQSVAGGPEAFLGKHLEKEAWQWPEGFYWEGMEKEMRRRARAGPITLERIVS